MLQQVFNTLLKHIDLTRLGTDSGAADFLGVWASPKDQRSLKNLDLRSKKIERIGRLALLHAVGLRFGEFLKAPI